MSPATDAAPGCAAPSPAHATGVPDPAANAGSLLFLLVAERDRAASAALALALPQHVDHDVERTCEAAQLVVRAHLDVCLVEIAALQSVGAARELLDGAHDRACEQQRDD